MEKKKEKTIKVLNYDTRLDEKIGLFQNPFVVMFNAKDVKKVIKKYGKTEAIKKIKSWIFTEEFVKEQIETITK